MGSIRRPSDSDNEDAVRSPRPSIPTFRRLLSTDSTISSIRLSVFDLNTGSQPKYSLCSVEFYLKILELVIAVVCAGLYSNGMRLMQHSIESQLFPNVVFSAFIIISSVIALGYILGHMMPPILIRIFDIVGITLYFVSACVTVLDWYEFARFKDQPTDVSSARMLLAQACLSLVNVGLYGIDISLSIKKAFTV